DIDSDDEESGSRVSTSNHVARASSTILLPFQRSQRMASLSLTRAGTRSRAQSLVVPDGAINAGGSSDRARAASPVDNATRPSTSGPARFCADAEDTLPAISRIPAILLMIASTALIAFNGEFLVTSIHHLAKDGPLNETFIGMIIIPVAGNAAEHITAMSVAARNKMDLAIGVSVGSSIQIGLYITPLTVIIGWMMGRDMTLRFSFFNTSMLLMSVFLVNFLILKGNSHYLKGVLLCVCYVNIG
ncbi:hypothetical protein KEM55_002051, partial [Ascosphaera atra]